MSSTITNPGSITGGVTVVNAINGLNYPNSITGSSGPYIYSAGTGITQNPWATESTMNAGKLNLNGDNADLVINGRSLTDTLTRLEERLNILSVNEKLESEWTELKELGDQYRKLEEHIKDKMKTYESLKRYDQK